MRTPESLVLAERVRELRDTEALTMQQVANRLGLSRSYVSDLLADPNGELARARKDSYSLPCPDCGKPMSGSGGIRASPERCRDCAAKGHKFWTRDKIIETFQAFHIRFGRPPSSSDYMGRRPSQMVRQSAARTAEVDAMALFKLPPPSIVQGQFGGWRHAVVAAGFAPAATGGAGHREQGTSDRAIAKSSKRQRIPRTKGGRKKMPRTFVVLSADDAQDELWHTVGNVDAITPELAIESVAAMPGRFRAVPAQHWREYTVGEVVKLAVVAPSATDSPR